MEREQNLLLQLDPNIDSLSNGRRRHLFFHNIFKIGTILLRFATLFLLWSLSVQIYIMLLLFVLHKKVRENMFVFVVIYLYFVA